MIFISSRCPTWISIHDESDEEAEKQQHDDYDMFWVWYRAGNRINFWGSHNGIFFSISYKPVEYKCGFKYSLRIKLIRQSYLLRSCFHCQVLFAIDKRHEVVVTLRFGKLFLDTSIISSMVDCNNFNLPIVVKWKDTNNKNCETQ